MTAYGYARVSARDQNLSRQTEALTAFGVAPKNIFADKKSGKDFDRAAYLRLVKKLKPGDLIAIKSIDRLGRNYTEIVNEWKRLVHEAGADIVVLDMPLLDTRERADTLVGKFLSDIVLQLLSFVAENERTNIRARQAEGIALAKSRGVQFGRPKKEFSETYTKLMNAYYKKSITLPEIVSSLGVSKAAFLYHYYRRYPARPRARTEIR